MILWRNVICTFAKVVKYVKGWLTCISISSDRVYEKINVSKKSICMLNICQLAARMKEKKKKIKLMLDLLVFLGLCSSTLIRNNCSVE